MRIGCLALIGLSACGSAAEKASIVLGPDAATPRMECADKPSRCVENTHQVCQGGDYVDDMTCTEPTTCSPKLGCITCDPNHGGQTCVGDTLHVCNIDGTLGPVVKECALESCRNGGCIGDQPEICPGVEGVNLIYVITEGNELLSFDPSGDMNEFKTIGVLSCPAGNAFPGFGGGGANPFSMSVDRMGTAWVLYTSGEIFEVSTKDASCEKSTFVPGTKGFQVFGMGFVADAPGETTEKLFIAGGDVDTPASTDLATLDTTTMEITPIAPVAVLVYGPELTGTGDANLYGYYPGTDSKVVRFDKKTAAIQTKWPLPTLDGNIRAWAFAHWGGRFYIFVTAGDLFGPVANSQVIRLDPVTGDAKTLLENLPYKIVGAGVSTCAPIDID